MLNVWGVILASTTSRLPFPEDDSATSSAATKTPLSSRQFGAALVCIMFFTACKSLLPLIRIWNTALDLCLGRNDFQIYARIGLISYEPVHRFGRSCLVKLFLIDPRARSFMVVPSSHILDLIWLACLCNAVPCISSVATASIATATFMHFTIVVTLTGLQQALRFPTLCNIRVRFFCAVSAGGLSILNEESTACVAATVVPLPTPALKAAALVCIVPSTPAPRFYPLV